MATYYVDNTLHAAANAVGQATGAGVDYLLLQSVGTQVNDVFNGYGLRITAGTGQGQQRRIVSYVHSGDAKGERCVIVDSAWTIAPTAGSDYEITTGCDSNTGLAEGSGSGGAWQTIDRAMNAIADAGAGPHEVYVRAGRAYQETATIDTAGQSGRPVIIEGYSSVPGDGGMVTIDGEGVRSSGITSSTGPALNYLFRNLRVANCTYSGFDLGSATALRLVDCIAENNGNNGFTLAQDCFLLGCRAVSNSGYGFYCNPSASVPSTVFVGCLASGNGNHQFRGSAMVLLFCTASGLLNGKHAVSTTPNNEGVCLVNCTLDGADAPSSVGLSVVTGSRYLVLNTIFSNLYRGIQASTVDALRLVGNNTFFNCSGDNMVNCVSQGGDVLADPRYVDAAGGDFRLLVGSPVVAAGFPPYVDMGALQHRTHGTIGGPCQIGTQA